MNISACHINHGIRPSAFRDGQFCLELCARLSVPFYLAELKVEKASENAWRDARYQALCRQASLLSIPYIVCGHNLDDQVETFLLRLFRGTAPSGATAIKPRRELSSDCGRQTLLRPMLAISRAEIEFYLNSLGEKYVVDESNLESSYTRNFLRLEVLPLLRQRFGAVDERIEQFRLTLLAEDDLLSQMARALLDSARLVDPAPEYERGFARAPLEKAPEAVRFRALARILEESALSADKRTIERFGAALRTVSPCNLPGDRKVLFKESVGGEIFFVIAPNPPHLKEQDDYFPFAPVPVALPTSGSSHTVIAALNCVLKVTVLSAGEQAGALGSVSRVPPARSGFREVLSLPPGQSLCLRPRSPGDRIEPLGMPGCRVRLKKYLHGRGGAGATGIFKLRNGVTRALRAKLPSAEATLRHLPVLAMGEDVVWVPGFGIAEGVKVKERGSGGAEVSTTYLIELIELGAETTIRGAADPGTC